MRNKKKQENLSYAFELKCRAKEVEAKIARLEKETAMPQPITAEFMAKYRQLNEARIEKATIQSREFHRNANLNVSLLPVYSYPK
jgi:predicted phage-related endonuclease